MKNEAIMSFQESNPSWTTFSENHPYIWCITYYASIKIRKGNYLLLLWYCDTPYMQDYTSDAIFSVLPPLHVAQCQSHWRIFFLSLLYWSYGYVMHNILKECTSAAIYLPPHMRSSVSCTGGFLFLFLKARACIPSTEIKLLNPTTLSLARVPILLN